MVVDTVAEEAADTEAGVVVDTVVEAVVGIAWDVIVDTARRSHSFGPLRNQEHSGAVSV